VYAAGEVTTVYGGNINFIGRVVNAACAVSSESQTVILDQVRLANLNKGIGHTPGNNKNFTIELVDCDTSVSSEVEVTFLAPTDASKIPAAYQGVTFIAGSGANPAQGVGLQIFDWTHQPVRVDGTAPSATRTLSDVRTVLPFSVGFISLVEALAVGTDGAMAAGSIEGSVNFDIRYF